MNQPSGIAQLIEVKRFLLKNGIGVYQVRQTGPGEYGMYKIDGEEQFVGYVVSLGLFFKVTHHRCGLTLSKEITYNEVIIEK